MYMFLVKFLSTTLKSAAQVLCDTYKALSKADVIYSAVYNTNFAIKIVWSFLNKKVHK